LGVYKILLKSGLKTEPKESFLLIESAQIDCDHSEDNEEFIYSDETERNEPTEIIPEEPSTKTESKESLRSIEDSQMNCNVSNPSKLTSYKLYQQTHSSLPIPPSHINSSSFPSTKQKCITFINQNFRKVIHPSHRNVDSKGPDLLSPFVTTHRDGLEEPSDSPPKEPLVKRVSSPRRFKSTSNCLSISVLKERAMKLQPLENLQFTCYDDIIHELEIDKQTQLDSQNFRVAAGIAMAISHVEAYRMSAQNITLFREIENAHEQEVGLMNEEIKEFDRETRKFLVGLERQQKQQRQALLATHENELRTHLESWKSTSQQKRYSHPSASLIIKRKQYQLLMDGGRYTEAELCAKDIEMTEQRQIVDAVDQVKVEFRESKRKLQMKHEDELAALEVKFESEHKFLIGRRELERGVLLNLKKKRELKGEALDSPEKVWQHTKKQKLTDIGRMLTDDSVRPSPPRNHHSQSVFRTRGRFEQHASLIRLPQLDFEHM
jgi:hypothetical protein